MGRPIPMFTLRPAHNMWFTLNKICSPTKASDI